MPHVSSDAKWAVDSQVWGWWRILESGVWKLLVSRRHVNQGTGCSGGEERWLLPSFSYCPQKCMFLYPLVWRLQGPSQCGPLQFNVGKNGFHCSVLLGFWFQMHESQRLYPKARQLLIGAVLLAAPKEKWAKNWSICQISTVSEGSDSKHVMLTRPISDSSCTSLSLPLPACDNLCKTQYVNRERWSCRGGIPQASWAFKGQSWRFRPHMKKIK